MIKKLEWDSDFFEIKIGEILYDEQFEIKDAADFDLLYVKSTEDFEIEIPDFKKGFSETKVVFIKELNQVNGLQDDRILIFDELKHNLNNVHELAYESGKFSRFNLDVHFKKGKFKEMYKKWIENSINKTFADELLLFNEDDQAMGFVTYKISKETATIGLIAVNSNFQRRGIGQKLLNHVEDKLFRKGIKKLLIPTQQLNNLACNFYEKQGYKTYKLTYIKHYWRNDTI